ncbi:hypothetical protein SKAU_G00228950 [Synaphobranchus kaupii]|uniref:Uncharacterized protein n=1 Tax=Synaphobranchus kaupii TaxID=118154 RepID=A0A9Q1F5N5_SYNKA|nr:hypothetical protein SKAU_G00228950 [Synaphobranchus kaupii]
MLCTRLASDCYPALPDHYCSSTPCHGAWAPGYSSLCSSASGRKLGGKGSGERGVGWRFPKGSPEALLPWKSTGVLQGSL